MPSRPSPKHKLAILFPVSSKDPRLIWIKCERSFDRGNGITYDMPVIQHLLEIENLDPEYRRAGEFLSVKRNVLRGFNLSYTLQIICRETFMIDGSTPNVSVRHIPKGQMTYD
ncbi:hypothetical protein GJ744_007851 [Endocarpon pusillum]|uniref:Uncharacterized protein n=1 Tax=Endocarpon pusillum TaxID=364733 RepID=A0A8H7AZ44_9EURO|nr:hypothetical protein GJ744_007851 [Endocarpon pusillum]